MATNSSESTAAARLARLLSYLESDPANPTLLSEAAEAAFAVRDVEQSASLLDRRSAVAPLTQQELALKGLIAMHGQRFDEAASIFTQLLEQSPADPSLRFNLAWSRAMLKEFEQALAVLDEATSDALPQAAMLEVQILHELGRLEDAETRARSLIDRHPEHEGLMAAVSVLALDLEDTELAARSASRGGAHPDALTTLGSLALADDRDAEARQFFERALETNTSSPRAWVGKGLTELAAGEHAQAAEHLEHGARLFNGHIGSWIAAGWAHLMARNMTAARRCFEEALSLDPSFAETQGSLAVIAAMEGDAENARRLTEVALRLDRQSFAGALAQSLLLQAKGQPEMARRIVERALNTPIDRHGRTIARSLAKRGHFA
jgi:tetratricopeptide (TPR) repeat protein